MTFFRSATLAVLISLLPAVAHAAPTAGLSRSVSLLAETGLPGVSLCHEIEHLSLKGIPLTSESIGYALSTDGCSSELYTPISSEEFRRLQINGHVPSALPLEPNLSTLQWTINAAVIVLLPMGILIFVLVQAGLFGRQRRMVEGSRLLSQGLSGFGGRKPVTLTEKDGLKLLAALCAMAQADGEVAPDEISRILIDVRNLTGRKITVQQVLEMSAALKLDGDDLKMICRNTKPGTARAILDAARRMAMADGSVSAAEQAVLEDLTHHFDLSHELVEGRMQRNGAIGAAQSA